MSELESTQTSMVPAVEMELKPAKLGLQVKLLDETYRAVMQKDTDYGTIPGTPKPTLYKPGAEILMMAFNLRPESEIIYKVEDLDAPYFDYTVRCTLYSRRTGAKIGDGLGSANTRESRYAFRWLWENELPLGFDKTTATKRSMDTRYGKKYQYRRDSAPDEVYTLKNTVLKMSEKRALVDAVLRCTGASRIFTQDIEDMTIPIEEEETPVPSPPERIPEVKPEPRKVEPEVKTEPSSTLLEPLITSESTPMVNTITWTVKGASSEEKPISEKDRNKPYTNFVKLKIMNPITEKYGVTFEEERTPTDEIIEIRTSQIDEKQLNEVVKTLSWALARLYECVVSDIDVKVTPISKQ